MCGPSPELPGCAVGISDQELAGRLDRSSSEIPPRILSDARASAASTCLPSTPACRAPVKSALLRVIAFCRETLVKRSRPSGPDCMPNLTCYRYQVATFQDLQTHTKHTVYGSPPDTTLHKHAVANGASIWKNRSNPRATDATVATKAIPTHRRTVAWRPPTPERRSGCACSAAWQLGRGTARNSHASFVCAADSWLFCGVLVWP